MQIQASKRYLIATSRPLRFALKLPVLLFAQSFLARIMPKLAGDLDGDAKQPFKDLSTP